MKAKTKFTRLWSILLALVMVVGMLPSVALAAEPATTTATATADFTSTGNPTTALALLNAAKTADAADSTWDSSNNTLTLKGVNFETTAKTAVILPADAKIVLKGDNTIKGGDSDTLTCYGIYAEGSLTISGSGTLNVTGGTATGEDDDSYGIYSETTIDISGGTVNATGGKAADKSYGIYSGYSGTSTNAISISGSANVTAKGGAATDDSYGIYTKGNITITDGTVTAEGGTASDDSYGIYTKGNITITDGTVTAEGGTATGESYGICAKKDVNISGGTVTATGGKSTKNDSYGIYASGRDEDYIGVKISGDAHVTATGGEAGIDSYGINAYHKVNIAGGTVNANGGTATNYSFGIYTDDDVNIAGGTVNANGGTATNNSSGIYAHYKLNIAGGTVTAQAGTAKSSLAFIKPPSISISPNYWWRTSESGTYTASSNNGYVWDSAHTYVEIRDTAPAAATTYTVNVTNGTASVSKAAAGTIVTLNANDAPSGKVFDKWVVESGSASITLTDATNANTTFKMPAGNVSVKATYKAASHTHSYGSKWETDASKHWHKCSCGDKSAEAVHTAGDWIIDTAATATTVGTKHKECTTCGYVMETGTIPATGSVTSPQIIEGDGAKVTHGKKAALSFRSDAEFGNFIRVEIDGNTLDVKNYTVKEGSTIVTLKADYVSTLSVGTHTIGIVSNSGTATATFTVEAKQTTGGEYNPNTGAQDDVPQTGDNSMMALWIAVLFVSGFGVVATAVYGKKRKSVK